MINDIYPPKIGNKIPAFAETVDVSGENKHIILKVPFQLNVGVGLSDIHTDIMSIMIKSVATNRLLTKGVANILTANGEPINSENINSLNYNDVYFAQIDLINFSKKLKPGSYFKVQLAFIPMEETDHNAYYSTASVVRYISSPFVYISNLMLDTEQETVINPNLRKFIGVFNKGDSNEFLYSGIFNIYKNDELFETSGEILFDSSNYDSAGRSCIEYLLKKDLDEFSVYEIEYVVTTGNLYVAKSPRYKINNDIKAMPDFPARLIPTMNYEEGLISIDIHRDIQAKPITGRFRLLRTSSLSNFKDWDLIKTIDLISFKETSYHLYTDFFIDYGVDYMYAIEQINEYSYVSTKKISTIITATFEHMFLTDGKRQLKIKYNPKVTNFKETSLVQKIDTLGGKYPFIFRNGQTKYHELTIAGLISRISDEENLFSLDCQPIYTHDLTDDNFIIEKQFREEVLNWINNKSIKYLKSPAEGSYLVATLNSTLSPTDSLSRMIYSITIPCVEIDENSWENLEKYNLIIKDYKDKYFNPLIIEKHNNEEITHGFTVENFEKWHSISFQNFPSQCEITIIINNNEINKHSIQLPLLYDAVNITNSTLVNTVKYPPLREPTQLLSAEYILNTLWNDDTVDSLKFLLKTNDNTNQDSDIELNDNACITCIYEKKESACPVFDKDASFFNQIKKKEVFDTSHPSGYHTNRYNKSTKETCLYINEISYKNQDLFKSNAKIKFFLPPKISDSKIIDPDCNDIGYFSFLQFYQTDQVHEQIPQLDGSQENDRLYRYNLKYYFVPAGSTDKNLDLYLIDNPYEIIINNAPIDLSEIQSYKLNNVYNIESLIIRPGVKLLFGCYPAKLTIDSSKEVS